ncbi:hypothetical protein COLO4_12775 [Corchorus olitorius]|uniref:Uncharacterized protein n=1 Tax=Corchorus olitorius TaxID=93759 RepID=A0A1R3JZP7_9ROSI|nr:hypothetical protein COLO4_12775 [Corchorus olitorius]
MGWRRGLQPTLALSKDSGLASCPWPSFLFLL